MEALILQYGGALAVFGYIIVGWWRSRNESKGLQTQALDTALASLASLTQVVSDQRDRFAARDIQQAKWREEANERAIAQQNEIDELKDTTHEQAVELKRQEQEKARLQERIAVLEAERNGLRQERDQLRQEREALNAKVYKLECEVEDLKRRGTGPLPELAEAAPAKPEAGEQSSEVVESVEDKPNGTQ